MFSELVRDKELAILSSNAYQVTDMEGRLLDTTAASQTTTTSTSATGGDGFPDILPDNLQRKESVNRQKEGNLNLANFAITSLKEHSEEP